MYQLLDDFPSVDDSPHADSCILLGRGDSLSPHYVVYEVARDFLSTPRVFVVIAIESDLAPWPSQREDVDTLGVMTVNDAALELETGEQHLLFRFQHHQLEIISLKTTIVERVYGFSEATQALTQVLSKYDR